MDGNSGALSTTNPGTDFDLVTVSGGNLSLAGLSELTLDFSALGADDPNSGNPFWTNPLEWTIVDVTGTGTNFGSTHFGNLTNPSFASGTFATIVRNGDVVLQFTPVPVPEPSGLLAMAGLLAVGGRVVTRIRRQRRCASSDVVLT